MKFLLTISFILLTFAGQSQDTVVRHPHRVLYAVGIGGTQYGEFDVNMEVSLIPYKPKFYVSLVADAFTAATPKDRKYTTAQIGGRFNYALLRHSQAHRLLLFSGGKYATQGRERPEAVRDWFWEAGGAYLYLIPTRMDGEPWLKFSISYENILNGRLFCSLGLQTIF